VAGCPDETLDLLDATKNLMEELKDKKLNTWADGVPQLISEECHTEWNDVLHAIEKLEAK
jgi:hypothetical protein